MDTSKSNRKINSNDVQSILGKKGIIRLPLFIKKNNDEGKDFYFMGDVFPELDKVKQTTMSNDSGKQISVVKIRFNLVSPVSDTMYNYLQEKRKIKKPDTEKKTIIKLHNTESKALTLNNPIPLFNFYAAAGTFSEMQTEKDFTLIDGPEKANASQDYFACKIMGESMNRVIPNGSICLFKHYNGGSRNGKIVLVENMDIQDQDFNSAFTIKTYSSEKLVSEEGWEHTSITLRPNSYDDTYKNIIVTEENGAEMRVVGEFIKILD